MRNENGLTAKQQEAVDAWDGWRKKNPEGTKAQFRREGVTTNTVLYSALKLLGRLGDDERSKAMMASYQRRQGIGGTEIPRRKYMRRPKMLTIPIAETNTDKVFVVVTNRDSLKSVLNQLMEG
jgi:hypothetical protein